MGEIIMPKLGANMIEGTLGRWLKKEGDKIKEGEPLFEVITDKVNFEVESEKTGVLEKIFVKEGEIIPILKCIGLIKEENIENKKDYVEKKELIEMTPSKPNLGKINPLFIEELKNDFKNKKRIGNLPSKEKIAKYKENGANIGENVYLGKGTYIIAEEINIEDETSLGENCLIQCEKLHLGKMVIIGNNAKFTTTEIFIDDLLYGCDDITIGRGGTFSKESKLIVGKMCYIGDGVVLNTTKEIIIGNEVCISARAMIYTHGFWQPVLDGYSTNFSKVIIEEGSWIGINSIIMPGVRIGRGATIISNSLVATDIQKRRLAGGVPCKTIKTEEEYLRVGGDKEKNKIIKEILRKLQKNLESKGFNVNFSEGVLNVLYNEEMYEIIHVQDKEGFNEKFSSKRNLILITLKDLPIEEGWSIFNLNEKKFLGQENKITDEIRESLRKQGIRLKPILWRYKQDKPKWVI